MLSIRYVNNDYWTKDSPDFLKYIAISENLIKCAKNIVRKKGMRTNHNNYLFKGNLVKINLFSKLNSFQHIILI